MKTGEQVLRFLASGGVAAGVNWLSRIGFSQWLDYSSAVLLAYGCGMLTAYLLFRAFVFGAGQQPLAHSVAYYTGINALGLAITWGVSMGLGLHLFPWLGMDFYPLATAHAIGVAAPTVTSYLGHRYLTFR